MLREREKRRWYGQCYDLVKKKITISCGVIAVPPCLERRELRICLYPSISIFIHHHHHHIHTYIHTYMATAPFIHARCCAYSLRISNINNKSGGSQQTPRPSSSHASSSPSPSCSSSSSNNSGFTFPSGNYFPFLQFQTLYFLFFLSWSFLFAVLTDLIAICQ